MQSRARQDTPPNRVRSPTGCPFAAGCSPPRLAATQLPLATCAVTSHDKDLHLADKASSRTHDRHGALGGRLTQGHDFLILRRVVEAPGCFGIRKFEDNETIERPLAFLHVGLSAPNEIASAILGDRLRSPLGVALIAFRIMHFDNGDQISAHIPSPSCKLPGSV